MTQQDYPPETAPGDPDDLATLTYAELDRRRDALAGQIEAITIEGGVFDGRLPSRMAGLAEVREALRRKREQGRETGRAVQLARELERAERLTDPVTGRLRTTTPPID